MDDDKRELSVDFFVRTNDTGPDGKLRGHVIFDYLQTAAAEHASVLGVGMPDLKNLGILWVLSRIKVAMNDYPSNGDTVRIRTYPTGISRLFALRQLVIESAKTGERFGVASSCWLMLNDKTLRPVNPAPVLTSRLPSNEDKATFFPDLGKIPFPDGVTGEPLSVTIGQSCIDYNDHVNNSYYPMFALDYLAAKYGKFVRFGTMQVNFNSAVKFGETLSCAGTTADGSDGEKSFCIEGTVNGRNAFQTEGTFFTI